MNLLILVGVGLCLLIIGAVLGRYYTPDQRPLKKAAQEGQAYVRGLVELLEGNQDAAIKEITQALKQNTKTVDAYLALGTLFRTRGEYERAVRVHQSLLVRRDLDKKVKMEIHVQLALDFKAAGFPKRAVKALEWVVTSDSKQQLAWQELAALYQEVGQWEHAALAYKKISKITQIDMSKLVAHMFAQKAQEEVSRGDFVIAQKDLKKALSANSESIHALDALGEYQKQKKEYAQAAKAWRKALLSAPDLAAHFFSKLEEMFFELNSLEEIDRLFDELTEIAPGNVHVRLAHARFDSKRNQKRALVSLNRLLEDFPHLLSARRAAAHIVLQQGEPEQIRHAFEEMLAVLEGSDRGYRCSGCGHAQNNLFWRCPSCRQWESVCVAWGRRAGERTLS